MDKEELMKKVEEMKKDKGFRISQYTKEPQGELLHPPENGEQRYQALCEDMLADIREQISGYHYTPDEYVYKRKSQLAYGELVHLINALNWGEENPKDCNHDFHQILLGGIRLLCALIHQLSIAASTMVSLSATTYENDERIEDLEQILKAKAS